MPSMPLREPLLVEDVDDDVEEDAVPKLKRGDIAAMPLLSSAAKLDSTLLRMSASSKNDISITSPSSKPSVRIGSAAAATAAAAATECPLCPNAGLWCAGTG